MSEFSEINQEIDISADAVAISMTNGIPFEIDNDKWSQLDDVIKAQIIILMDMMIENNNQIEVYSDYREKIGVQLSFKSNRTKFYKKVKDFLLLNGIPSEYKRLGWAILVFRI